MGRNEKFWLVSQAQADARERKRMEYASSAQEHITALRKKGVCISKHQRQAALGME